MNHTLKLLCCKEILCFSWQQKSTVAISVSCFSFRLTGSSWTTKPLNASALFGKPVGRMNRTWSLCYAGLVTTKTTSFYKNRHTCSQNLQVIKYLMIKADTWQLSFPSVRPIDLKWFNFYQLPKHSVRTDTNDDSHLQNKFIPVEILDIIVELFYCKRIPYPKQRCVSTWSQPCTVFFHRCLFCNLMHYRCIWYIDF